jgi:hypothetical protein
MPYLIYNVFTDDGVILYRLLGMGSSVDKSIVLAQQHLAKRTAEQINSYMTLHGHSFENNATINRSLMLSRKEVESRWLSGSESGSESCNRDLFGYVIEKMNLNEPVKDKAYQLARM